jgi:hypothetical protein
MTGVSPSNEPKPASDRCECGKSAIVVCGAVNLCVDCYYRLTVAQTLQLRNAVMNMNHAAAEMDFVSGLRNFTPRMQVPDLPPAPMTLNNINVDRSVVGSINTGEVAAIDVSITYLNQAGNKDVSNVLKILTEAIVNTPAVAQSDKSNMLDQVAYLSEQAAAAAKDRKPGVIRAALGAMTQAAGTVSAVAAAWNAAEPVLKSHFGFP